MTLRSYRRAPVFPVANGLLFVLPCLVGCIGCSSKAPPKPSTPKPAGRTVGSGEQETATAAVTELASAQGLTGEERARLYHLDMGGEIIPLDWLLALESSSTGKPFLENIERFGLLPDSTNRYGLPIGITAAESRDSRLVGKMVGLNCAACHTAELTYRGQRLRIDGGAGMFDAAAFATDLSQSIAATVGNTKQLFSFIGRVRSLPREPTDSTPAPPGGDGLIKALGDVESFANAGAAETAFVEHIQSLVETERTRSVAQPETALTLKVRLDQVRDDAKSRVGEILHGDLRSILEKDAGQVFSKIVDREAAVRDAIEKVVGQVRLMNARLELLKKLSALRSLPTTDAGPGRADDFATARNTLFDSQFAIAATAPCSIPSVWGTTAMTWTDWDGNTTSAIGRSMATALAGGASFDPETYVSTVSPRNLFQFEELIGKMSPPVWPAELFGAINRDDARRGATLFQQHCMRCHPVDSGAPPDLLYDLNEIGTDRARAENFSQTLGDRPFADALRDAVARYLDRANRDQGIGPDEFARMEEGHPNQWRATGKYAARSLIGVWATAPYLHNGSVPTLDDLLRPVAERPKTFAVGHSEFDPVKVGLSTNVDGTPKFVFDTSKPGNANTGHEFGADLSDAGRHAIIEYLKGR